MEDTLFAEWKQKNRQEHQKSEVKVPGDERVRTALFFALLRACASICEASDTGSVTQLLFLYLVWGFSLLVFGSREQRSFRPRSEKGAASAAVQISDPLAQIYVSQNTILP